MGISQLRRGANIGQAVGDGLGLVLTSRSAVGGLQIRFAALADTIFLEHKFPGRMVVQEDVLAELRRVGFQLNDEYVVSIRRTAFTRHRVGLALWVAVHVLRSNYTHVHLASNPSPLSWLFGRLRRWFPPFSVSVVDARVPGASAWMRALRYSSAIDCLSPSIAGKVIEKQPELAHHVKIAPASFAARPQQPEDVHPAATRDIDLLFVGRFVPGKGIELLDAMRHDLADARFYIVGSGPLRPQVFGAVIEPDGDVFGLMLRSKIFLSLQLETNYPSQAIYEAVRAGCALVVTDTGDTRRFLDEHAAVLVPPQPAAIVEAVHLLLGNSDLRDALSQAAQNRLEGHTVRRFADYFLDEVVRRGDDCEAVESVVQIDRFRQ